MAILKVWHFFTVVQCCLISLKLNQASLINLINFCQRSNSLFGVLNPHIVILLIKLSNHSKNYVL